MHLCRGVTAVPPSLERRAMLPIGMYEFWFDGSQPPYCDEMRLVAGPQKYSIEKWVWLGSAEGVAPWPDVSHTYNAFSFGLPLARPTRSMSHPGRVSTLQCHCQPTGRRSKKAHIHRALLPSVGQRTLR